MAVRCVWLIEHEIVSKTNGWCYRHIYGGYMKDVDAGRGRDMRNVGSENVDLGEE
ncbi:hypothetical protein DPMN_010459 [Dreissena polymorpha]|uniref:Uncharacterized protein n=1 Tax=Dreissena polymorpha TaxID=45954 RepID=A0A9D4N2B7_DREPO|nr:hypothetical protein DPMN_010459 [Dreissena polymorpha]